MTQIDRESFYQEAYSRGRDAAGAVATWIADGNSDRSDLERLRQGLEDGDPAAYDSLPSTPNLSGEWADDPTPLSLAREITGDDDPDPDVIDLVADGFEAGVSENFEDACTQELDRWLS